LKAVIDSSAPSASLLGRSRRELPTAVIASLAIVALALRRERPTYGAWPWVAAASAAPATAMMFANRERADSVGAKAIWASLPLLLWHQTEEWVLPGGFLPWFNREIWDSQSDEFPVTPRMGFTINVLIGWCVSLAAAASVGRAPSLACGVLTTHLGNGALHIREAAVGRRYNPGLASALALAPLGAAGALGMVKDPDVRKRDSLAGVAGGAIVAAGLVGFLRGRARQTVR
jgi:uncharacterized protein with HXXEE motif